MDNMNLPEDRYQRTQAVDITKSFLCEAPAGSGKTALLTQRILKLLTVVEKPEAILALTFTRKAAAEMRHRVLSVLREAHGGGEGSDEPYKVELIELAKDVLARDSALGWRLLENPNRLRIATFDGLCASFTKLLPLQSSLGFNLGVTDDAAPLFDRAVTQLLGLLDQVEIKGQTLQHDITVLLEHVDNRLQQLKDLFVRLLSRRDVWMPLLDYGMTTEQRHQALLSVLQDVLIIKVSHIKALLNPDIEAALCHLGAFAAEQLKKTKPDHPITSLSVLEHKTSLPGSEQLDLSLWKALRQFLLTGKGELRKKVTVSDGFPAGKTKEEKAFFQTYKQKMMLLLASIDKKAELSTAFAEVDKWPVLSIDLGQRRVLEALLKVLPFALAQLQLVFQSQAQVDFVEIASRAREALGSSDNPSDLLLQVDQRIEHLLVDEFQDTSFHQVSLLKLLISGWQKGDGRTLFCVGDAMQSIYGFRGANVGLFLQTKEIGIGDIDLTSIQLTSNFRSAPKIVHWINHVFQNALPQKRNIALGAVPFSSAVAFLPDDVSAVVDTAFIESEDYAADEALWITEKIKTHKKDNPNLSIAILVRNRRRAVNITRTLREKEVGFTAVDLEPLADRTIIKDLVSLTLALLNPVDRIAWLACVRAPWCGLLLDDIECLALACDASASALLLDQIEEQLTCCNTDLTQDGHERLQRFYSAVSSALSEQYRKSLRDWIWGVWVELGGRHLMGHSDHQNVDAYFDMLERLELTYPQVTSSILEGELIRLYARPASEDDPTIQIMTMHKAKGLEFDVVFLPGLHHRERHSDQDLMLWYEHINAAGEEQVFFAPLSPAGSSAEAGQDPNYVFVNHEHKKRKTLELARLLYVACTRAKKRLYLCAEVRCAETNSAELENEEASGNMLPPVNGSLLSIIWPFLKPDQRKLTLNQLMSSEISESLSPNNVSKHDFSPVLQRVPSGWRPTLEVSKGVLDAYILDQRFDNRDLTLEEVSEEQNRQRILGTAVHKALENAMRWARSDLLESYAPAFWQRYLQHVGARPEDVGALQAQHCAIMKQVNQHEKWHWLQQNCHLAKPEWPLLNDKGRVVLDLVIFDKDTTWIVDYKTSPKLETLDDAEFIQQQMNAYRADMSRYSVRIKNLGYTNVKCALFLVTEGLWAEYEHI